MSIRSTFSYFDENDNLHMTLVETDGHPNYVLPYLEGMFNRLGYEELRNWIWIGEHSGGYENYNSINTEESGEKGPKIVFEDGEYGYFLSEDGIEFIWDENNEEVYRDWDNDEDEEDEEDEEE